MENRAILIPFCQGGSGEDGYFLMAIRDGRGGLPEALHIKLDLPEPPQSSPPVTSVEEWREYMHNYAKKQLALGMVASGYPCPPDVMSCMTYIPPQTDMKTSRRMIQTFDGKTTVTTATYPFACEFPADLLGHYEHKLAPKESGQYSTGATVRFRSFPLTEEGVNRLMMNYALSATTRAVIRDFSHQQMKAKHEAAALLEYLSAGVK